MRLIKFSIISLTTLPSISSSLRTHTLEIPSSLDKSVFSTYKYQIGPASGCHTDLSSCRLDIKPYSVDKLATRDENPRASASELLSSLHLKAPQCLDAIEQTCPTVFAAIRDTAANNTSAADLYRNMTSSTCLELCRTGTEPIAWIQWLNRFSKSAVVKADINKTSLQGDWIDWPTVSRRARGAMIPWQWTLVANLSTPGDPDGARNADDTNLQCSSRSSILESFLVINICIVVSGIIFSRRHVIHVLTCGSLGEPPAKDTNFILKWMGSFFFSTEERLHADKSRTLGYGWIFGGVLWVGLSLAANFINAVMVRTTPGYSDTPLCQLALLWTTRPRAGWFMLLWTNIQSRKNAYVSAAWSAGFAEFWLQIFTSYYLIRTAHYGVKQGFYSIGMFQDIPDGQWALLMYAGAILWTAIMGLMFLCALMVNCYGIATATEERFSSTTDKQYWQMYFQWGVFVIAFIGQWIFWAGYVHIASDTYCPPRIWHQAGIWVGFGVVTNMVGGAF